MTHDEPTHTKEDLSRQVQGIIQQAPMKIENDGQLAAATSWFGLARKWRKEAENFFERLMRPIQDALATHREERDKMLEPVQAKENELNREILGYRAKARAEADKKQEKANAAYSQRVERTLEQGKDPALVPPPKQVAAPATTVKTGVGPSVTFQKVKIWFLTKHPDITQETAKGEKFYRSDARFQELPDSLWVLDLAKVSALAKAGTSDVVQQREVEQPSVR